jgi:DNA-binding response OmpR family regulator
MSTALVASSMVQRLREAEDRIRALVIERDTLSEELRQVRRELTAENLEFPREWGLTLQMAAMLRRLLAGPGAVRTSALLEASRVETARTDDPTPNIVSVRICNLRARGFEIETVYGVGYRLSSASRAAILAACKEGRT